MPPAPVKPAQTRTQVRRELVSRAIDARVGEVMPKTQQYEPTQSDIDHARVLPNRTDQRL